MLTLNGIVCYSTFFDLKAVTLPVGLESETHSVSVSSGKERLRDGSSCEQAE